MLWESAERSVGGLKKKWFLFIHSPWKLGLCWVRLSLLTSADMDVRTFFKKQQPLPLSESAATSSSAEVAAAGHGWSFSFVNLQIWNTRISSLSWQSDRWLILPASWLSVTLKQHYVTLIKTHCFKKRNLTMHVNTSHKTAIFVKPDHILQRKCPLIFLLMSHDCSVCLQPLILAELSPAMTCCCTSASACRRPTCCFQELKNSYVM